MATVIIPAPNHPAVPIFMNADSLTVEEFGLFGHLAKDFVDRGIREWRPEQLSIARIGMGRSGEILPTLDALIQKGRVLQTDEGLFRLTLKGQFEARELIS